jgi:hypothetical protein
VWLGSGRNACHGVARIWCSISKGSQSQQIADLSRLDPRTAMEGEA